MIIWYLILSTTLAIPQASYKDCTAQARWINTQAGSYDSAYCVRGVTPITAVRSNLSIHRSQEP